MGRQTTQPLPRPHSPASWELGSGILTPTGTDVREARHSCGSGFEFHHGALPPGQARSRREGSDLGWHSAAAINVSDAFKWFSWASAISCILPCQAGGFLGSKDHSAPTCLLQQTADFHARLGHQERPGT